MDISALSPATAAGGTSSVKTHTATSGIDAPPPLATDTYTSKLSAIAAKYDPTNIPLSQVPELGQALYEKGILSMGEKGAMMALPLNAAIIQKEGFTIGGLDIKPDGNVNLVAFYDYMKSSQNSAEATQNVTDVYKTFEDIVTQRSKSSNAPGTANVVNPDKNLNVNVAVSAYKSSIDNTTFNSQKIHDVLQAMTLNKNDITES